MTADPGIAEVDDAKKRVDGLKNTNLPSSTLLHKYD